MEEIEVLRTKDQEQSLNNDFIKLTARVANLESDVIDLLKA